MARAPLLSAQPGCAQRLRRSPGPGPTCPGGCIIGQPLLQGEAGPARGRDLTELPGGKVKEIQSSALQPAAFLPGGRGPGRGSAVLLLVLLLRRLDVHQAALLRQLQRPKAGLVSRGRGSPRRHCCRYLLCAVLWGRGSRRGRTTTTAFGPPTPISPGGTHRASLPTSPGARTGPPHCPTSPGGHAPGLPCPTLPRR